MQPNLTATPLRPAAHVRQWPALVSIIVAVALMVSSLHHLSCVDNDATGGSVASLSLGLDKSAPPSDADRCLPGHCHCVCHGSAQASGQVVSSLTPLADAKVGMREDRLPPADAGDLPFKPPRA
jgi:hypothetical protein